MKRLITFLTLLLVVGTACAAHCEAPLKLGVLAFRPKPQSLAQWQPVANYLQTALKRPVELALYDYAELNAAAARRAVDVVITTASHFIHLQQTYGLSAPLATLISREGMLELGAYGGVIFTRADLGNITSLADLSGKRIATVSTDAFGGYQMQVFEMLAAGMPLPAADRLLITGQPHDRVIEAVLTGRADAGFIRAGLLESLTQEGKLDPGRVKVLNRQNLPDFPFAVSTRLYPEWPVAVMPQVDKELAARLAAALFLLPHDSFQGTAAAIHGFTIPASYDVVEHLLRHLRLPPFDRPPEFTLADLWRRYATWISVLAGLLLLLAGTSAGLVAIYRRSLQSLRDLEQLAEKEKLLLASLAEGVYGVDPNGNCIFVNPRALAMLGFSEDEALGKNAHQLFHLRQEDASPAPRAECPTILTLHDGMKRELEDAFIRKDGSIFPVSLAASAMRHGNAIVGAVVAFQDITERKQAEQALMNSEERFRRLAENARDVIFRMSLPDGAYEYVSPAAIELTGYTPTEFYRTPQLLREFVHPDWRGYIHDEWLKMLHGEIPARSEFQIIHKSGDIRWVNQRNILVRDEDGRPLAIEGIITDVTEMKKIEEDLRRLNEELEQRVRERTVEFEAKNADLEQMNKLFVGRELRMVELKERIRELEEQTTGIRGKPKYD